ncbi:MAG: flagellar biosynthetic protein FliO [Pseudomonadota bacterium]
MNRPNTFDEIAESDTMAAAGTTLASPLAAVAATELPPVMPLEVQLEAAPAASAAAIAPAVAQALPLAATATQASTSIPLGTLPSSTAATLPMLGALLLVVALILMLGKLVKRVQGARAGQGATLHIKGGVQVGAKERVVWMQAGDTHLLLGVSPGRVQTLHVFEVAPDFSAAAANESVTAPAAETPATRDFSERLKTLLAHAQAKGIAPAVVAAASAKPAEAAPAASKPQFSFRA